MRRLAIVTAAGLGLLIAAPRTVSASTLLFNTPTPTVNGWTHISIPLAAAGWVVDDWDGGVAATEAQMQAVLANLTGLFILTEWMTGPDDTNVDNIVFGSGASDSFSAGNGGWLIAGPDPESDMFNQLIPTSALPWDQAFGNPAGSVRAGDVYFWTWISAPALYLGNQFARYGETLSLDIFIRSTDGISYPMIALVAPDDAQPPAVPEPTTLVLLATGLAAAVRARSVRRC